MWLQNYADTLLHGPLCGSIQLHGSAGCSVGLCGYAVTWPCGYMAHSVGLQSYVACSVGLCDYAVMRLSGGYTWLCDPLCRYVLPSMATRLSDPLYGCMVIWPALWVYAIMCPAQWVSVQSSSQLHVSSTAMWLCGYVACPLCGSTRLCGPLHG